MNKKQYVMPLIEVVNLEGDGLMQHIMTPSGEEFPGGPAGVRHRTPVF